MVGYTVSQLFHGDAALMRSSFTSAPIENAVLRCELLTDFYRLESLAGEWRRLFEDPRCRATVFQSWPWVKAYWKRYGTEVALCTPVVFAGESVVGFVPLVKVGSKLQLMGDPHADYNGVLCLANRANQIFDVAFASLLQAPFPWTECAFKNLPEGSPLLRNVHTSVLFAKSLQVVRQYSCPTVLEDGSGVFERLARKESLRRHENRLRRRGTVNFRHIEDRREIRAHLNDFFSQHIRRHAASGVRSQFQDHHPRAMIEALVDELDPSSELRFGVLELNGIPIAYHLGFQHGGKLLWYLPTFDPNYWHDSPGEVLLRFLFRYAQAAELAEFDFTIGDEAYKRRFANHIGKTWSVYFYRSPLQPNTQLVRAGRFVAHWTRGNPRALAAVRLCREVFRNLIKWVTKWADAWHGTARELVPESRAKKGYR